MIRIRYAIPLLALLLSTACVGIQPDLPSITESPTNSRAPGKIVWHDLITSTPAESWRFYEELFGWEFDSVGSVLGFGSDDAYSIIRNDGQLIGGMIDVNKLNTKEDASQWVTQISVADINAAAAKFESQGETVFTPPTMLAQRGQIAVVADPTGAPAYFSHGVRPLRRIAESHLSRYGAFVLRTVRCGNRI